MIRFVQVSDLHFGEPSLDGDGAMYERLWTRGLMTGMLGHDMLALEAAEAFLMQQRMYADTVRVVMTGDLTSHGAPDQFGHASFFLSGNGSIGAPGSLDMPSLYDSTWDDRVIPGNHDKWPGHRTSYPRKFPRCALGSSWPGHHAVCGSPPYYVGDLQPVDHTWAIRFIGIDTERDVGGYHFYRLFAIGHFVTELNELEPRMPAPQSGEIRVLLLHHCREASAFHHGITRASADRLERFISDHRIHVLMSGHLHQPLFGIRTINGGEVMYSRCGTTAQQSPDRLPRDLFPEPLSSAFRRKRAVRSLLTHSVVARDGSLEWSVNGWDLNEDKVAFEASKRTPPVRCVVENPAAPILKGM